MNAFAFIAVEKKKPYRCEVWEVDQDFLKWGRGEYERLLMVEADCRQARNPETGELGYWPHYQCAGAEYLMKPAYL